MSQFTTRICVGALGLHLLVITTFSLRDLATNFPARASWLPRWSNGAWHRIRLISSAIFGEDAPPNILRQTLTAYANAAGIENGYSYFAPIVPDSYKLVFVLRFADGRTEFDLPHVGAPSAGYRLATLLDILGQIRYAQLREMVVRSLAAAAWRRHPEAVEVTAIIAAVDLPTMKEFMGGTEKPYRITHTYEFRRGSNVEEHSRH